MKYKELRGLLLERRFSLPKSRPIHQTLSSFSIAEKVTFLCLTTLFIISGLSLLWRVSDAYLVEIPVRGGTLVEGVIGNPRFINPVLALSEADKNLTSLVYSGLIRVTPEGEIENDLAREIIISENKLTYTAQLRGDAVFHDGEPVTADDIIFTVQKIIDPLIKSPRRGNWEGVTISKIDEMTVSFTLKKAYAPFIYNLSLGILPRHIWKNVSDDEFSFSQFNTLPVGSGPYKVDVAERNSGGIPNYYKLVQFEDSTIQTPFIKNLVFRFYPNEEELIDAFNEGKIDSLSGISPEKALDL
ncbi:MAG: ABC transporter substrate-binding protein, partial [Parcubacteria group bacterium]